MGSPIIWLHMFSSFSDNKYGLLLFHDGPTNEITKTIPFITRVVISIETDGVFSGEKISCQTGKFVGTKMYSLEQILLNEGKSV